MTPERMRQIDAIIQDACQLAPGARAAFLEQACAGDEALRREVELLLALDEQGGDFIETPAYALAAPLLVKDGAPSLLGQRVGPYQIIALLGKGGMGEVYQARDTRLDRTVALKILPADLAADAERLRRFTREAKTASALNHPHVATIYEIGAADGVRFIAMEYVAGQTLAAKINGAPLAINDLIEIGSQTADALDEAHSKSITHRDIKPANVMLNERGQVKVLDFGLAKIARPVSVDSEASTLARTQPGVVLGTVPYMSPEQALGHEVDHRTDIFSLGVVLYEMATGRLPFAGATTSETLDRILHSQPDALARFNYEVPAELERIVRKCLEKERERRYQSARELLVDLKNLKRDSASTAPLAVQAEDLASKVASRQRRALLALVVLILSGVSLAYFVLKSPLPPKVAGSTTLVSDGHLKAHNISSSLITALVTDGARLYFSELVGGQYLLAQVSCMGGETVIMPTPFRNTFIQDISPNKAELLVASREAEEAEMALWVLPVLGGSPRRVGDVLAHGATYSPDGRMIVYAHGSALYLVKSDGTQSHRLVTVPGSPYWPRWSPDGSRLRFTLWPTDSPALSLWEASADGTNAHPLLPGWNDPPSECCGTWTADGKFFVFQSTRNRATNVWALREKAGLFQRARPEPAQLTVGPINYRAPVPSQAGGKLFVVGEQQRGELVRYDVRTQQFVNFLGGISAEALSFSQDGAWIAYVTYPEGSLWRSRADGRERLQLSSLPMRAYHPRWSPDGKKIVFMARAMPDQPWKSYLVSVNGGSLEQLLPGPSIHRDPTWSLDGNSLVFSVGGRTSTPRAIQMLNLVTRQLSQLPSSEEIYSPRWSPDGRYVAAMRMDRQELVLYDFKTQAWRELTKLNASFPAWSREGKYIYFAHDLSDEWAIFRVEISAGKLERVASLKGFRQAAGVVGRWMGLAPDDLPLVLRDVGTQDIYALAWQTP